MFPLEFASEVNQKETRVIDLVLVKVA